MLIPEFSWQVVEKKLKKLKKVGMLEWMHYISMIGRSKGQAKGFEPQKIVEMVNRALCP